jgi:DNA-binding NarL/FixJ family response regulator
VMAGQVSDPSSSRLAFVLGGDLPSRHVAAQVVTAEGFSVVEPSAVSPIEAPSPAEGDLVILLSGAAPDARVRAIQAVAREYPKVRLIATMPPDSSGAALRRALRCGADGIVLDNDLECTLAATVLAVGSGQLAVPRLLRRRFEPTPLSHREKEIVRLVVAGMTNRQIADRLFIAESTVKSHLSSAFEKLDARSRAEISARVLDPDEGIGLAILSTDPGGTPTPPG